jgi:hypothetical protein
MNLEDALEQIIEMGLRSVVKDFKEGSDKLEGSIDGFNACRGLTAMGLRELLAAEHDATKEAKESDGYWKQRYREIQVEWVCNVASAILHNEGFPVIIPPTARGMIAAAKVIGIQSS